MSAKNRREVAYWLMLLFGLFLNGFQIYKYANNQLLYEPIELIVLIVGVSFNFAPKFLLNLAERFFNKKME